MVRDYEPFRGQEIASGRGVGDVLISRPRLRCYAPLTPIGLSLTESTYRELKRDVCAIV